MDDLSSLGPDVVHVEIRVVPCQGAHVVEVATRDLIHFRSEPMSRDEADDLARLWAETLGRELGEIPAYSIH